MPLPPAAGCRERQLLRRAARCVSRAVSELSRAHGRIARGVAGRAWGAVRRALVARAAGGTARRARGRCVAVSGGGAVESAGDGVDALALSQKKVPRDPATILVDRIADTGENCRMGSFAAHLATTRRSGE